MLWAAPEAGLELRREGDGSHRLSSRFPYNKTAVFSDGGRRGRPRKERFAPGAMRYRVETPSEHGGPKEIHLLMGHSYDRPLASVRSGTMKLTDTDEALTFEATITREVAETSHGRDALALLSAGLAFGVSPGFCLPPERRVKEAERIENEGHDPENGAFNAIIRTILSALLY